MFENFVLYGLAFFSSLVLSLVLTPAARSAALLLKIIDHPHSDVKTHKHPVPYLGGVAIFLSFSMTLLWIRVLTTFPTGTLRSLRGILIGGSFIFLLGLADDIKLKGLHYRTKLFFQISAAILVMVFGVHVKFVHPSWMAWMISAFWIVGVTNSLNLIDIMDGLSSGTIVIAALAFLFISLPTEGIYVNFAAAALAGSTLGFLPFNLSKRFRIFMGDSGSLFVGFVASSLALGTSYQGPTNLSVFAPLLILAIPLYDTILVFSLRIMKGISPFLGSKDHFPLRLEVLGWKRPQILSFTLLIALLFSFGAFFVTKVNTVGVLLIYSFAGLILSLLTIYILKAKI
ncbi:hypothetical protein BVX98_03170 [bacterium F11]|nr:hypothetical protein BVX98_03170 [bacterium F11]